MQILNIIKLRIQFGIIRVCIDDLAQNDEEIRKTRDYELTLSSLNREEKELNIHL